MYIGEDAVYLVGHVKSDGSLFLRYRERDRTLLQSLNGANVEVIVHPLRTTRTLAQNRWLWGVAYPYIIQWHIENTGELLKAAEVHCYNMQHIQGLKPSIKNIEGEEVVVLNQKRSSNMTVSEFSEMKQRLQAFYAEQGLVIPDPDEVEKV